jgi:hypothetical protein
VRSRRTCPSCSADSEILNLKFSVVPAGIRHRDVHRVAARAVLSVDHGLAQLTLLPHHVAELIHVNTAARDERCFIREASGAQQSHGLFVHVEGPSECGLLACHLKGDLPLGSHVTRPWFAACVRPQLLVAEMLGLDLDPRGAHARLSVTAQCHRTWTSRNANMRACGSCKTRRVGSVVALDAAPERGEIMRWAIFSKDGKNTWSQLTA